MVNKKLIPTAIGDVFLTNVNRSWLCDRRRRVALKRSFPCTAFRL